MNITDHFTWREALWLPQWNKEANADDEIKRNLIVLFETLEEVRTLFGDKSVIVHCAYRPTDYNKLVGGAAHSAHIEGKAVDFHIAGENCDDVRKTLLGRLDEWHLRMEDLPGSSWVHVDTRNSVPKYFKP